MQEYPCGVPGSIRTRVLFVFWEFVVKRGVRLVGVGNFYLSVLETKDGFMKPQRLGIPEREVQIV